MEQILQKVSRSEMLPLLDGFSRYNQILVSFDDQLKMHFELQGELMPIEICPLL